MRHLSRRRAPALLVAMCAALAMASTALGDVKASQACRGALGKNLS